MIEETKNTEIREDKIMELKKAWISPELFIIPAEIEYGPGALPDGGGIDFS